MPPFRAKFGLLEKMRLHDLLMTGAERYRIQRERDQIIGLKFRRLRMTSHTGSADVFIDTALRTFPPARFFRVWCRCTTNIQSFHKLYRWTTPMLHVILIDNKFVCEVRGDSHARTRCTLGDRPSCPSNSLFRRGNICSWRRLR